MKRLAIIFLVLGSISCETEDVETRVVDIQKFTFQIPETWHATTLQGYDSFAGTIEINDTEIITYDLGRYSNPLMVDPAIHDIKFIMIDNKGAKVVKPKSFRQGTTGVYFDSLETTKTTRFQMSGTGLSLHNQMLLLKAIESLRFKN